MSHRAATSTSANAHSAALLAPRSPVHERLVEADGLGDPLVVLAVAGGLVGGVEDHRPHAFGEQRGVDPAEVGAIGDTDVGELLVPEGGADHVHVARRVLRRVVTQRVAVHLLALGTDHHLLGDRRCGFACVVRCVVGVHHRVERGVVETVDAAGSVDAARVEADDVEATLEAHLEVDRFGRRPPRSRTRTRPGRRD